MTTLLAGGVQAQTAGGTAPVAEEQPSGLEDIVVTASRRSESLRDVPTAVSAYGGDRLKEQQIVNLTDVSSISPNIQISSFATNANVAIRGIGNSQVGAGADPGVAVHVDGVYLGQAGLAVLTFLDVDRVEVLRGPQGTLFGRNATGGAVNLVPRTPTTQFDAGVDLAFGVDPEMIRSSAYVSGPLSDSGKLLGRVAVSQDWNKGYTRNANPALKGVGGASADIPRRLDDLNTSAIRAQLEWRPSDSFKARLSVEYDRENDNGPAAFILGTPDPNQQLPIFIQGMPTGDPKHRIAYANVGRKDLDSTMVNLITDTTIGGGSLKTTLSYAHSSNLTIQDGDGASFDFTHTGYRDVQRQYFGEVLYASDAKLPFTYVVGANFFDARQTQNVSVPIAGLATGADLNNDGTIDTLFDGSLLPTGDLIPVTVNLGGTVKTRSYAAFAHAQYEVLPGAKVFAGGRYSHDRKIAIEYNNFFGDGTQRAAWSRFTYEVGASYDISNRITGYVKYATGYKSGGYGVGSRGPAVDPETNANLEAGLKGSYFDGRLQANLAAFHMKYDNLQVSQVIGTASTLSNAAKATITGLEAEFALRPVEHLRIDLSGAYTDAKFDKFITQDSARPYLGVLNLAGNRLPQAPEWSGSAGIFYDIPMSDGTLTPSARYDWKSRMFFSEFNTDISSQKAVGRLDLNLLYKSADGRWTGSIFATNVTNEQIKNNVLIVSGVLGSLADANYRPGRQVGISFGYRFR
ncbi:hypothetical protein ASE00_06605 [Sphingomonas sp. Root710]|uniref:TonB-dependent receptor n=1 Tax=Sphingomonas sp. Root710 TaxID=1736594 RepID=UPI0006F961C5|nr:TonB-dependent receptor [Sphingomonas sp. Root710]KRB86377.1 hypothetical protein ASE00_06605 [Sphingomonas sp. Root710]